MPVVTVVTARPLLALPFALLVATSPAPRGARVLAEEGAPYHEDAPGARVVAAVCARAVDDGGLRLVLELSPCGAGVEPMPGLDGLPGTNLRSAEELERLLLARALRLVTRHDRCSHSGTVEHVERGPLPVRTVARDGVLGRASTGGDWPTRVVLRSVVLPAADTWTYLEADGVPRLAVRVVRAAGGVALTIDDLGAEASGPREPASRAAGAPPAGAGERR